MSATQKSILEGIPERNKDVRRLLVLSQFSILAYGAFLVYVKFTRLEICRSSIVSRVNNSKANKIIEGMQDGSVRRIFKMFSDSGILIDPAYQSGGFLCSLLAVMTSHQHSSDSTLPKCETENFSSCNCRMQGSLVFGMPEFNRVATGVSTCMFSFYQFVN